MTKKEIKKGKSYNEVELKKKKDNKKVIKKNKKSNNKTELKNKKDDSKKITKTKKTTTKKEIKNKEDVSKKEVKNKRIISKIEIKTKKTTKKIKLKKSVKIFIIVMPFILLTSMYFIALLSNNQNSNLKEEKIINYNDYYFERVKVLKDKTLYKIVNNEFIKTGLVYENAILDIIKDNYVSDGYFKISNMDFYIDYDDLEKSIENKNDIDFKNYVPFDNNVKTNDKTILYRDNNKFLEFDFGVNLPILIKDDDYFGVLYNDELLYIKNDECEVIDSINSNELFASKIPVLVYHATYDSNNRDEKNKCIRNNATICLSDKEFEKQIAYFKENDFYSATMDDLDKFIDGKIRLPKKTVVITIDDGYFLDAAVSILEKYDMHATLFLIGALKEQEEWNTEAFDSSVLEVHSHTYELHIPNRCSGGQGSILKCLDKESILKDLEKSREQLNGTSVFCYPFFEYNDYLINVLKEAGFKMAFAGGRQKVKVGSDKMKLPRYGIINTTTLDDIKKIVN